MDQCYLMPGEWYVSREPCVFRTILGSCVSVVLFNTRLKFGGLNHYMLPRGKGAGAGNGDDTGKYGDTACAALVRDMLALDANPRNLQAKVFGGGAVVANIRDCRIGIDNVQVAREILHRHNIPVVAEHVENDHGLKLEYHNYDNRVLVRKVHKSEFTDRVVRRTLEEVRQEVVRRAIAVTLDPGYRDAFTAWFALRAPRVRLELADNLFSARNLIHLSRHDFIILDLAIPYLNPVEFLGTITLLNKASEVILLTGPGDDIPLGAGNIRAILEKGKLNREIYMDTLDRSLGFITSA